MPCLGLLPTFQQERDFGFSTDQRCQSSGYSHIKATDGTTLIEHVIDSHGLGDATQCLCSQVLKLEIALDEAVGVSTDHDRIGLRQPLNARTNVGDLSECQLFLTSCST